MCNSKLQVKDQLRERAAYDVDPELSPTAQYMRTSMGVAGYKHLLAVGAHTWTSFRPAPLLRAATAQAAHTTCSLAEEESCAIL